MKTMLQRPDDSPFPGLARDPLPGQRHDRSPARSRTAAFLLFAGIRIHKPKPGDANENTEFHLPATVRPRTPCHPDGLGGHGTGRMHKERGAAAGGAPGPLGRC